MSPRTKKNTESSGATLDGIFEHLKKTKDSHYVFSEAVDYSVSSGSLNLDLAMGGGMCPGIATFSGVAGGGKTSCALTFAANFQKQVENSCVVYIKSEGRLSDRILKTAGVDQSPNKWILYPGNIFEEVGALVKKCVDDNPDNMRFMFIIDSMDALIRRDDTDKPLDESDKVAGNALLTSTFCKKMALRMGHNGHIMLCICQVRSKVSLNPYAKEDPKLSSNSGGNAIQHYANWILEFQPNHYKNSKFFKKGSDEALGHTCKVAFRKSMTENVGRNIEYPIRYGVEKGGVWLEKEIISQLGSWGMLSKAGAWISLDKSLLDELSEKGYTVEEKFQGEDSLLKFLEENPKVVGYLFNKFKTILQNLYT
tara:strand:+ start:945 stop:2045 length:1101 start_codon:yes stop_codon:yes gene_type:complete